MVRQPTPEEQPVAVAAVPDLPDEHVFEGKSIVSTAVEIPGVAGGLREAMKFGWVHLEHGDEWCLVLRGKVRKVRFDPLDKEDYAGDQVRVHVLDCEEGTFIDESTVAEALKRQREIIEEGRKAEEAAKGITRLDFAAGGSDEDPEEFALALQHSQGVHSDGRRENCPVCQQEADAESKGD